jgi:TRAP-type C4-dicarboxylate transport system permease small subunit
VTIRSRGQAAIALPVSFSLLALVLVLVLFSLLNARGPVGGGTGQRRG